MTKDSGVAIADSPDALPSLRESFALHLDATRASKTTRIYLDALDSPIRHLVAHAMPLGARAVIRGCRFGANPRSPVPALVRT